MTVLSTIKTYIVIFLAWCCIYRSRHDHPTTLFKTCNRFL